MINQPVVDGVEGEFEAVGDAEFIEDVVKVILYGLFGDEKLFADFFVAEALGDELNDFFFAVGKKRLFAARTGLGRFRERFHDFRSHTIVEPDFAGVDTVNALDEKVRGGLLQNDTAGTQAHGADDVTIIFRRCQYYDARRKLIKVHFFKNGETVLVRHAEIEEEDIGLELREHLDALSPVLRFADDGHFVVGIEKLAKTVAKNGVIVG